MWNVRGWRPEIPPNATADRTEMKKMSHLENMENISSEFLYGNRIALWIKRI